MKESIIIGKIEKKSLGSFIVHFFVKKRGKQELRLVDTVDLSPNSMSIESNRQLISRAFQEWVVRELFRDIRKIVPNLDLLKMLRVVRCESLAGVEWDKQIWRFSPTADSAPENLCFVLTDDIR